MNSRFEPAAYDDKVFDLEAYRPAPRGEGCLCPRCDAARERAQRPSLRRDANRIVGWCALGIAVGLLLAFVLDRLIGGPGLGVMLGR